MAYEGMQNEMNRNFVSVQIRSERNRVDRENVIQVCRNPIVEDDFHGFLHRNCEGTEQLRNFHGKNINVQVLSKFKQNTPILYR